MFRVTSYSVSLPRPPPHCSRLLTPQARFERKPRVDDSNNEKTDDEAAPDGDGGGDGGGEADRSGDESGAGAAAGSGSGAPVAV